MPLERIISGGQTGVDQAALRAARVADLDIGGWCPPGRACETGPIPPDLPLTETPHSESPRAPDVPRSLRTEWNVRDADATLILRPRTAHSDPGTAYTLAVAKQLARPVHVADPTSLAAVEQVVAWLHEVAPRILNVAGPRESTCPGIGELTYGFLCRVLAEAAGPALTSKTSRRHREP